MSPSKKALVGLLADLLNQSHERGDLAVFKATDKLLYALGARVIDQNPRFFVVFPQ